VQSRSWRRELKGRGGERERESNRKEWKRGFFLVSLVNGCIYLSWITFFTWRKRWGPNFSWVVDDVKHALMLYIFASLQLRIKHGMFHVLYIKLSQTKPFFFLLFAPLLFGWSSLLPWGALYLDFSSRFFSSSYFASFFFRQNYKTFRIMRKNLKMSS
jgi:hypothetical protein